MRFEPNWSAARNLVRMVAMMRTPNARSMLGWNWQRADLRKSVSPL